METPRGIKSRLEFEEILRSAWTAASSVPGFLTEKESYLLVLLAACPMGPGTVLEIGSFKGRSTVLLGTALRATTDPVLHACDRFGVSRFAEPNPQNDPTVFPEFSANVGSAGLTDQVVVHRLCSSELAKTWSQPLRLLWVDGDHSFEQTEADFEAFHPFIQPGGIIAFHDVLQTCAGPRQVFAQRILLDERWGACGVCGSIGWAQRARSRAEVLQVRDLKVRLYKRVAALACCLAFDNPLAGLNRLRYRILRGLIPHARPEFHKFVSLTGYPPGPQNAGFTPS